MGYALNLEEDGRVLSAALTDHIVPGAPVVDELPEGDISDYRYVNDEFIFDPVHRPEIVEAPTTEERLSALESAMLEMLGVE